jgi:hypothetical protein
VGDGLGAATTEVFEGAAVVEAVLEEVDEEQLCNPIAKYSR